MSYASGLLATYPSTLLSDDLVSRTAYDNLYPSSVPYMSNGRLLSDDLAFNQMNYDTTTTYRPTLYAISNSTSVYPTKNYQKPFHTNGQTTVPTYDSFPSLNDITEYSDSLGTASNTNTASSVARSINGDNFHGTTNMFAHQTRMPNNPNDHHHQPQSMWNSPPTKQKGQAHQIKAKSTTANIHEKSSAYELDDDLTPVQSPQPYMTLTKQPNHLQRNATTPDMNQQTPSLDIQAWVNDTKKESFTADTVAEQAWSVKVGHLHQVQAQRGKEKAKSTRALPLAPKKVENKPTKTKSQTDTSYPTSHDSYLDSLFDGDFFRKPVTNNYPVNSSLHQPIAKRNKVTTNPLNNANANNLSNNSKYMPQKKTPRYEPPTTRRAPPPITTTTWRKQGPKQHPFDSMYPYYSLNEFTPRELTHKDTDERFREALHKLRADRAEQQQKDTNEKTAKRLHYGDYVRHSTKDALLQNAVKPSPWSDFMHLKKGNLYSLSKEEKKQLYNQSKSYGERIRYRNFAIQHGTESTQSYRHSVPLLDDVQEFQSDQATPRQTVSKSVSRTSKRPDSASTNKSHTKQIAARGGGNRIIPNQTNRSNNLRPSDDEYEDLSDYDTSRKQKLQTKKKNVRYAKFDSFGRTTNGTEENDNDNHSQGNLRMKNRDTNEDLFTVREEKTPEAFEDTRYKKP